MSCLYGCFITHPPRRDKKMLGATPTPTQTTLEDLARLIAMIDHIAKQNQMLTVHNEFLSLLLLRSQKQ